MPQNINNESLLKAIMKYPGLESSNLEFKSELPKNDQVIKTVIAFCNQHGGKLVLGVADDRTIIGLDESKAMELMEYLERSIYSASAPPIIPNISLQRIGNKIILVIEVSEGMSKPYYRQCEGLAQGTYLRIGNHTVRANSDMIEELRWQSRGISYESLPLYQATESDLDSEKLKLFFENNRLHRKTNVTKELLISYKLLVEEHSKAYPTVAGMLLFGKKVQYFLSEAMIICSHFKGNEGREAIASIDCNGTLLEQFEQAYQFITSRLNHSFKIIDVKREEKLEVPPIAIREILLNAVVHRNYHISAPCKIAIYNNRIEIFSPGNFPSPMPNLRLGLTNVRNMTICKIFREQGLIEKLGTGFLTVFHNYQKWKLPEPTVHEGDGFVKCILPREGLNAAKAEGKEYDDILALFNISNEISTSDVINILKLPRSTASRKLSEMVEKDLIKAFGSGRGTKYRLHKFEGSGST